METLMFLTTNANDKIYRVYVVEIIGEIIASLRGLLW